MNWSYCRIDDINECEYTSIYRSLSASRKKHIDRFRKEHNKKCSLAGEHLAKKLIGNETVIDIDDNGKPYAKGLNIHFSISHCDDTVVCVASDTAVGIDIERIKPINLRLAKKVCVDEEMEYLFCKTPTQADFTFCEDQNILHRFYEIWTAKEAYFKKLGTGITDLKCINILTLNREIHLLGEYIVQIVK